MRHKKTAIDEIVALAEREGLSYGQYVAREQAKRIQHRRHIIDTVKPRGISTIQAELRIDCPKQCPPTDVKTENLPHKHTEVNPFSTIPDGNLTDEAAKLYKLGYSVTSIAKQLGVTRYSITERLRRAEIRIRSEKRGGLPNEKILRIRALRTQGLTLRQIAIECDTVESTVRKYLKED